MGGRGQEPMLPDPLVAPASRLEEDDYPSRWKSHRRLDPHVELQGAGVGHAGHEVPHLHTCGLAPSSCRRRPPQQPACLRAPGERAPNLRQLRFL